MIIKRWFVLKNALISAIKLDSLLNFVISIALCVLAFIIGTLLIKVIQVCITKSVDAHKSFVPRKAATIKGIGKSVTKYVVYFFVFCIVLSIFGIDPSSIIAVAGVGSVALAFGAQSLVQDILAGFFILFEDQFGVGDIISVEGCTGTVEVIGLKTTRIRSADGNVYIIPNGQVKIITNMSKGFNRAVVDIGISYESDVDYAISVMSDELKKAYDNSKIKALLAPPSVLGVVDLSESAVVIRISADCNVGENWAIEREIRRIIKKRLDKENINIPYPQMVVHFESDKEDKA